MSRTPIVFALASALSAQILYAPSAQAQATEAAFRTTTLNLSAQADVRAKSDMATISLGAESEAATAEAAMQETSAKVNAIVAAMKRAGVAERDIQTQSIDIDVRYMDRSNVPRTIVGYQARTMLMVISRDMARAGPLLDAAIAAGANRMNGIRFGLSDPTTAQRTARDQALQNLREEADRVAAVMGQKVVRLVSVTTQAYGGGAGGAGRGGNEISEVIVTASRVQPGEQAVGGHAQGVFELAPR